MPTAGSRCTPTVDAGRRIQHADRQPPADPGGAVDVLRQGWHSTPARSTPDDTWYLAEGSSQPPFDTWILLQNPGSTKANVILTFMKDGGENQIANVTVPPTSRRSVHANEVVPKAAFATKIVADQPIVAERSVYLANGGGHNTIASAVTSKTWYLAEGSTEDSFDTWLLIQNPGRTAANVTVTYLRENGPPRQQKVTVGATSRLAINARQKPAVSGSATRSRPTSRSSSSGRCTSAARRTARGPVPTPRSAPRGWPRPGTYRKAQPTRRSSRRSWLPTRAAPQPA